MQSFAKRSMDYQLEHHGHRSKVGSMNYSFEYVYQNLSQIIYELLAPVVPSSLRTIVHVITLSARRGRVGTG